MEDSEELTVEARAVDGFPGAALVRLSGKGGPRAVRHLQGTIHPLLSQGKKDLLIDCANVEFFNSTSLGYLINLADTVRSAGGTLSFCRMPQKVYATFELLGLGEFFRFVDDEGEWARQTRKTAAPAEPLAPEPPAPQESETSMPANADSSFQFPATLPAWLEEVDHGGAPPLDHLRWSALLQNATRRMDVNPIAPIAEQLGIPSTGPLVQTVRSVLKKCQSPQDLLDLFDQEVLAGMCRLYGLSAKGTKSTLIGELVSFVNRSTTESLSLASAGEPPDSAPDLSPAGPDLTHERVLGALETCPLSKLLRNESAVREHVRKHLAHVLGREEVTRGREVGRHVKTKIEIDVSERFGILLRMVGALFGKKPDDLKKVFALLGQVVLLSGIYGRGNLFVVLVGEPRKDQALLLSELRGWIDAAGGRVILLHPGPSVK